MNILRWGVVATSVVWASTAFAANIVSFSDPAPLYSVYGQDRIAVPARKSQLAIAVVPYYQYAKNAKNSKNAKVSLGDRGGFLNMLGLLINDDPSSYGTGHKFADLTDETVLHTAYKTIHTHVAETPADAIFLGSTYEPLDSSDTRVNWGKYTTSTNFSRIGARLSLDYCFFNGVAISLLGGVAEYSFKQPVYTANPTFDSGGVASNAAFAGSPPAFLADVIQPKLMSQARQKEIGTMLGIDFTGGKDTGVEDTTVELSWRKGIAFKDQEGDLVLTAIPLVALSATLPTAEKKVVGKLFDVALGSDGFYGFTGLAEVSFDFPGMLKVGFGGSGTFYTEDAIGKQFVPTSEYQVGIYPWQVAITKRPGALWKAYTTVKAENFLDYLSCYVTYMYLSHQKDSITVTGAGKASFLGDKLGKEGAYTAQLIDFGFEYEVTSALRFGVAVQSVFSGSNVWKTTTFAGSLSFVF